MGEKGEPTMLPRLGRMQDRAVVVSSCFTVQVQDAEAEWDQVEKVQTEISDKKFAEKLMRTDRKMMAAGVGAQ
jgi:hypothetical protein